MGMPSNNNASWQDTVRSDTRTITRIGRFVIGGFIVAFGVWSVLMPLSSAVIATGKIIPVGQKQVIQHPVGGTILAIHAVDGQKLKKNDPIFTLDPVLNQAELSKLQDRYALYRATEARLSAQISHQDSIDFPEDFLKVQPISFRGSLSVEKTSSQLREDLVVTQRREFRAARESQKQHIKGLEESIKGLKKKRSGLRLGQKSLKARAILLQNQRDRMKPLAQKGYVARNKVNELEIKINEIYGQAANMKAEIDSAAHKISEVKSQISQIKASANQKNNESMAQVKAEIVALSSQIISAKNTVDKTQIRAPMAGILTKSSIHTIGGVVRSGDIIAEIIPAEGKMVEARIMLQDIDYVKVGQEAEVIISAFNQRLFDPLHAKVSYIAANSQIDEQTGESYFIARLRLTEPKHKNRLANLRAGMQSDVYIKTQSRVFMSYLLKPLTDSFRRAFREQ